MKIAMIAIYLMACASLVFPTVVGSLPDVMKPAMIVVYEGELYVGEGAITSVYSLKDLKLLRKFGKKGEGPGELLEIPDFPNKITVLKDRVFVTGIGKVIAYTREGTFVKEFRTHQRVIQLLPVGKNFVAKELGGSEDGKSTVSMIVLYNPKMEKIKELYRQEWIQQGALPGIKLYMPLDFVSFAVINDKVFVDESAKGFLIEVFDSSGKKLYQIKKDYEKLEVTSDDKNRLETNLREDPTVKVAIKRLGGWNEAKKIFQMVFLQYFPAIQGIEISGQRLYVRTFKAKDDKEEYLVMDLKGNIIKKVFIPRNLEVGFRARIAGGKLSSISEGRLYYVKENEDEEVWELHVEELK
jgi:hypothetical protein